MKTPRNMLGRRELVVIIILLFIGMNVAPSAGTLIDEKTIALFNNGNTLYVGGSGQGNYTKIQDAIDNANDDDTVFVFNYSSPYLENLLINKSIRLVGENIESTTIDGSRNNDVVRIVSGEVYISGFTIRNGGREFPYAGISLRSSNNMIIGNNLVDNFYGIIILFSDNNEIFDNLIINNNQCGIYLEDSKNNNISRNHIDGQPFNGIGLWNSSDSNMISRNTIINNEYSGIRMLNTVNNIITMNTISNNFIGVRIERSPNTMITRNNFIKNIQMEAFFIGNTFFRNNYKFHNNFWNRLRLTPKIIFGTIGKSIPIIPWINFDWSPAKEPYDIL